MPPKHRAAIGAIVLYVAMLVAIALFRNYTLVTWLVAVSTILAVSGALILALTFCHKARIQIGRRGLKFRTVRRAAAIATLLATVPLMVRLMAGSNSSELEEDSTQTPVPVVKVVIGVPHFGNDASHKLEDALNRDLGKLTATLPIEVRKVDKLAAPEHPGSPPDFFEHDRIIDELNQASPRRPGEFAIEYIFWGSVEGSGDSAVAQLYESSEIEGMQFGGTYRPRDFALPRLPPNDVVPVVRLMIAAQITNLATTGRAQVLDALRSALPPVKRLLVTKATPSDRDTAARLEYIVAAALQIQAYLTWDEAPLREALYRYICAFDDWNSPSAGAERMMTLRALAATANIFSVMQQSDPEKEEAIKLLRATVAQYQGAQDSRDLGSLQLFLGEMLQELGVEGHRAKFAEAVDAYQAALKAFPQNEAPLIWASVQYHIAGLQLAVAEREPGTQRLTDAVHTLNDVMTIWTREEAPREWARAQARLGEIFQALDDRDPRGGYELQEVAAEQSALEVLTPDSDPVEWGSAESLLGGALARMAVTDGATDRLAAAVTVLRAGATGDLRERAPAAWIQAQSALTTALQTLGEFEWRQAGLAGSREEQVNSQAEEHLEESLATARAGLSEATEDRYPFVWAYLQYQQAQSLEALGERDWDNDSSDAIYHLREATQAARAALRVLIISSTPENWADTQSTLGNTLNDLGIRESSPQDFQQAITAFEESEKIETRERAPDNWAASQNGLGTAFEKLAKLEKGEEGAQHLAQALAHYRASQQLTSPDRNLEDWITGQESIARTEAELGRLEPTDQDLKQAAQDYRDELKYLDADRSPDQWKSASDELNQVQEVLRARGDAG